MCMCTVGERRHGEEIGNLLYEIYAWLSMRAGSLYEECWL